MKKIIPHHQDEMTPIQREKAIEQGRAYDRIPVSTFAGEVSIRLTGCTMADYWHSKELMVETEIESFNRFGHDGLGLGPNSIGIAEAMGAHVRFPDYSNPYIEKPFIDDYSMLDSIEPLNPYKDSRIPMFLDACEMLKEAAGDVVGVGCSIGGPLTIAAYLRGVESTLKDMHKNPEQLHKLMKLVTKSTKNCIDALSIYDVGFSIADPVASGTLISAKMFREFVKPYLKDITEYAVERAGKKPSFHLCGNSYKIWDDIASLKFSVFSIDNVMDLELAKREIGDKIAIMGNVDPVDVILRGDKEKIFDAVEKCINQGKNTPKGYYLSPGCSLSLKTPIENIDYFMDAARIFGKV